MEIKECGSDSKKLLLLVNHLTGHKPEIALPTRTGRGVCKLLLKQNSQNIGRVRSLPPVSAIQV